MSQIALVTGASSGIGKGCAQALLKEGWTVVLTGRREDALKQAIEELGADGARGIAIASDVGPVSSTHLTLPTTRTGGDVGGPRLYKT